MIRIFLIGYMGAGKTTLGKGLAHRMGLSYIDTDQFIESRFHKKISEIFVSEGETCFREIEHRVLCEIAEYENVIVSTGGGTPCFNDNMLIMNNTGTTVYLEVSVKELVARLEASKTVRPVLKGFTGDDLVNFVTENLEKRKGYYEQAKICFNAEQMDTELDTNVLAEKLSNLIAGKDKML